MLASAEQLPADAPLVRSRDDSAAPNSASDAELAMRRRMILEAAALPPDSEEEEEYSDHEAPPSGVALTRMEGMDGSIVELAPFAQAAAQVFSTGSVPLDALPAPSSAQLASAGGLLPSDSPTAAGAAEASPFAEPAAADAPSDVAEFRMKTRTDLIGEILRLRESVKVLEDRAKAAESEFSQIREQRIKAANRSKRDRSGSVSGNNGLAPPAGPPRKRSRSFDSYDPESSPKRTKDSVAERDDSQ
jgi:hypothetical protein